MEEQDFHQHIKSIYQMLFEMATGNLSFRLPAEHNGDDLDRLSSALNTFAAQFQLALKKSGHIIPYYSYQNLTQLIFVVDMEFLIISFNTKAIEILAYEPDILVKKQFPSILDKQSQELFKIISLAIVEESSYHETVQFDLLTSNNKIYPAFCMISRLLYQDLIVISSVTTNIRDIVELNNSDVGQEHGAAVFVVQDLHDYIMAHLERPLPTLKELSSLFKTNEFKLKDSFRHFFKTSIYQFYNEERLKRAHLLIQQSDFTLKAIAIMSGFNNYITFSKAFKKRFGYAPSVVKRL